MSYPDLYAHVQHEMNATPEQAKFDVIVIGVGSMGSSTCYQLAKKGFKVLGLEQFDIPHEQGSHAGQSRIIRKAYGEDSDYVPLLKRAYENWKTLEGETGAQVYYKTGLVYFGGPKDPFLETVKTSSSKYGIPVNHLSAEACTKKYPQFRLPGDFQRLEEPDAGFLTPERSILLMVEQAMKRGAVIRSRERVLEWKRESGSVTVKTDKGTYTAGKLVITAGSWAGKMMPTLAPKFSVIRQVLAWVKPKNWDAFTLGKFPCWIIQDKSGEGYGFPILPVDKFGGPLGLKVALHQGMSDIQDPDAVNRAIDKKSEETLIAYVTQFLPEACESTITMKTCLYTNTPDFNFIIDFVPDQGKDVVMAGGFSGHGFKFVSVIGEILADLALKGKTDLPIGFLSASRF